MGTEARAAQQPALLSLRGLYAGYGGGDILRGVDLEVPEGSVTCVVGPNGAGKSTVLRVVSGLLRARAGSATFAGTSLLGRSPRRILDMGIVQVPQDGSLFPNMTVVDNVRMGAYTVRDRGLIERRMGEVQDLFPVVRERAQEKAGALSGGQQKMVEFARSLMLNPRLVLLDEPSMGLDPKTLRTILDQVDLMRRTGKTVLMVEQNARSGLRASTHGVVMESGRVRLTGSAAEVLDNPQIGELYLGGAMTGSKPSEPATMTAPE